MPHIHTQPGQHDHTASAHIVRIDSSEPRLMLHKHKKLGMYMHFGGHIELDETPWQTIEHELREESGYDLNQLLLLQPRDRIKHLTRATCHPQPVNYNTHSINNTDGHFHTDIIYAFVTDQTPNNMLDEGEPDEFKLFTRSELINLSNEEIYENCREVGLFILDTCLTKWEQVPAISI